MLIVFGGLPGTGKTTIARELARQLGALHLRIDTIEQTLRDCGAVRHSMDEAVIELHTPSPRTIFVSAEPSSRTRSIPCQ